MPTKEEEFKQRFVAVMQDLEKNGQNDPEAMWLIGSLACEIVEKAEAPSWAGFKQTMSQQTYAQLLEDFQTEGNRQHREGDRKKAYAIQVLGISLVAHTQTDPHVEAGDKILNDLIELTIKGYRASRTGKSGPN